MAIVNIDADEPMVFRRRDVTKHLHKVIFPHLLLFSELLEIARPKY